MQKILVVEDSTDAFALVHLALGRSFKLEHVKTQAEAARRLSKGDIDLVLLDVTLPDGDGLQFCSLLQQHEDFRQIPIVLLTGRSAVSDKVMAFSLGADDYLTKPVDPLELKARVETRLRKRESAARAGDVVHFNGIEIDRRSQRAFINESGEIRELDLTPLEFKILLLLAGKPDVVHARDAILDAVWGSNVHVYSRSVDTHVSKLRKKLGAKGALITSIHGSGYKLAAPVDDAESASRLSRCLTAEGALAFGRSG